MSSRFSAVLMVSLGLLAGLLGVPPARASLPGGNGKIAFSDYQADYYIATVNADGSGASILTGGSEDHQPAWSPDGTKMAFVRGTFDAVDIWTMNADGSNQVDLGVLGGSPAWSPDGTKIAFTRNLQLWVMNADGSGQVGLTTGHSDGTPDWSPDGSTIAFSRDAQVWAMNADGSNPVALTTGPSDDAPSWSPDGTKISFTRNFQVWVMNANGSGQTYLAAGKNPAWSPDGSRIVFVSSYLYSDLLMMNADGTDQTVFFSGTDIGRPSWQRLPVAADLSLLGSASPDPVTADGNLTYTLAVSNLGPSAATNVALTDYLPSGVIFVSVVPTQGTCSGTSVVICSLGQLSTGSSATVTIVITPIAPGTVFNSAAVNATEPDPYPSNNSASQTVTVSPAANTSYVSVTDTGFSPRATILASQGQTVQWNFLGPAAHTATDSTGMGLFDSGTKAPVSDYSFTFTAAGNYPYKSSLDPGFTPGTINVPLTASPIVGGTSGVFTITWASAPAPAGYVFDATIKRPGSTNFVTWKSNQTAVSATFTPDAGLGVYSFKSRLRKTSNGAASNYSAAASITAAILVLDSGFFPSTATLAQGGTMTWYLPLTDTQSHSISDQSGMALFNSGVLVPGSSYSFTFVGAGTYTVIDRVALLTSQISVPMLASPPSGGVTTQFAITWSSQVGPTGYVFDVQIKRPGSNRFVAWKTGVSTLSDTFTPDAGTGTYSFRGRVRRISNGKASGWSPGASIVVS